MNNEEVNEILAKFDGCYQIYRDDRGGYVWNDREGFETSINYTESLDKQVSIWEKLDIYPNFPPSGNPEIKHCEL